MDRISRLPDEVLCHILSFLPTKHAAATSVLSSRWVYLWLSIPVIDLDDSLYINQSRKDPKSDLFVNCLDMVSFMNLSQTIVKFRLHLHSDLNDPTLTMSRVNGFIENVFSRKVVEIDLEIFSLFDDYNYDDVKDEDEDEIDFGDYLEIPHSDSLKVLKVKTEYSLRLPVFPGCFPSLRVFDAEFAMVRDDEWMRKLFPCLPALEKLCLVADLTTGVGDYYFNVGGAALKDLELEICIGAYDNCEAIVVIDAPKLEYLRLQDAYLESYVLTHKPAISEARLHLGEDEYFLGFLYEVGLTRLTRFNELLQSLVNTKFISVSAPMLKEEKHEEEFEEVEAMVPEVLPSCLSSHVKEIEIKRLGKVDDEGMLKCLLDNAKVLVKLTVDSRVYIKDFWKACL